MALADPQSVTISTVAIPLPRVSVGDNRSAYVAADGNTRMSVTSQYGKRTRRTVRLDVSKLTPDPFIAAQNVSVSMSSYMVIDAPKVGYTNTEQKAVIDGFIAALQATSGALLTKILGGEN